ncbi:D-aminoacyl-tRNA deacylase [Marinobacter confluentis]|uniref:D-aminoacyl-tRNA deacylase n=1 Tax=Marinobacter confluentis TaxID=1697557 RepID=A0A4Z1C5N3_9GAMM|nr:D-aminoacyl-tRNA deacylase [Marinobacter confluentis]TGN38532.1 D-tyrosyl-tRNA(Tyr) deacylase [Marinobacter confluentis]
MKGLIQRVTSADVSVDGVRISQIEQGLLLFLGVEKNDNSESAKRLCRRIVRYRVFPDDAGRMNLSVADAGGSLLVVPQFTLAADTRSGNRPGFSAAAAPDEARSLYEQFIDDAQSLLGESRVAAGQFGADMQVSLTNNGPVTFMLESAE